MMILEGVTKRVARRVKWLFQEHPNSFLKDVSGVIHIGANVGQERELYAAHKLDVIWIEPIPEVFQKLKANLQAFPHQHAYRYLVTNKDNEKYELHIANNDGASSSIFGLGLVNDIWPEIHYERSILLDSITLASFVDKEAVDMNKYNALVMDTQGSELLVLSGARRVLAKFKYIKAEVADFELYAGCCELKDIDTFLSSHGFREHSRHMFASRKVGGNCYDIVYRRAA